MLSVKKPYHPLYVANYIISYCEEEGLELNNLKLQKILYFLQAQSLVEDGIPLFNEPFQKWKYGPVMPSVYHEYKRHGASTISKKDISQILRKPIANEKPNFFGTYIKETYSQDFILEKDKTKFNPSIKNLTKYDAFDLVEKTHQHSIWKDYASKISQGEQGLKYSEEEIREYFIKNPSERIWQK